MFKKILSLAIFTLFSANCIPITKTQKPKKNITIFIHGTLFAMTKLVHWLDCPQGLNLAKVQGNKYCIGRIPYILSNLDNKEFPLDSFYLFGWNGKLVIKKRMDAAQELYEKIKDFDGEITIIGHSHGCNVALNLAKIAQDHGNNNIKIDRLILIAPPVQKIYSNLIKSDIFRKIYVFYSTADLIQILDPQKLYSNCKKLYPEIPFFSERTYNNQPNLTQARIIMNKRGPSHLDLMLERFIKHLPKILKDLKALEKSSRCRHYTIKIKKIKHK